MNVRTLLVTLAVLLGLAPARAETPASRPADAPVPAPAPAPEDQPVDRGSLGPTDALGFDFLGGVAALGNVASCRNTSFAPGEAPPLINITMTGELAESESDLRGILDAAVPWTKKGRPYDEAACAALRNVLSARLRYHVDLTEQLGPAGIELALRLRPLTLVRHIRVSGNMSVLDYFRGNVTPIFAQDIERRLRLQPGSDIDDDPERQRAALAEEEQHVLDYLARRGYFEAEVHIRARPSGTREVTLLVDIDRGPAYKVGKITIHGAAALEESVVNDAVSQKICLGPLPICWRGRFSDEQLQRDRDALRADYQKKGYPGALVRTLYDPATSPDRATKTVELFVDIDERKKLTISFQGVVNKSEAGLRDKLTFNAAGATDDVEADASAEAVREAYQRDGRFQTVVRFERTRLAPSESCPDCAPHDGIEFRVDEGPEQPVRGVHFSGNRSFRHDDLYDVVKTHVFPALQIFATGGYVTSTQLRQDLDRLRAFYREHGFARAEVTAYLGNDAEVLEDLGAVAAQVTAGDSNDRLHVLFAIEEGERDLVESIGYSGNHALTAAELEAGGDDSERLRPGQIFTRARLGAYVEHIRDRYRQLGYRYVAVKDEVVGTGAHTRVTLTIREGVQVRTGKVIVRGNFKTARWIVTDQLGLTEGRVLGDELDSGIAALRATGLFGSVVVEPRGHDPVNLIVDVTERHDRLADLELAGGWSSDTSVFIGGTLTLPNLGGVGIAATFAGELGLERQRLQASLVFPEWVMWRALHMPFKLELQGRYRADDTPRFGRLQTVGGSATLSRQLGRGVILSLKYDWNRFGRSTELIRPPGDDQNTSSTPIETTTALFGPALLVDRRLPNALTPSSGFLVVAQLGVASRYLGGTDDFLKFSLAGQLFLPLGDLLVITNTARFDEGFPLGGPVLLPEVERFTAGGDTTVRGLEQDRLATEIIRSPLALGGVTDFRVIPAGGNIRIIHRLDLQLHVWKIFASSIFFDSGLVTNSFAAFEWSRVRQAIGTGVRLITGFGIFSIEYAFPLVPRLGDDQTGRLHFNFGFAY